MAVMMVLMIALLAGGPGGHMGSLGSHHASENAAQTDAHGADDPAPQPSSPDEPREAHHAEAEQR